MGCSGSKKAVNVAEATNVPPMMKDAINEKSVEEGDAQGTCTFATLKVHLKKAALSDTLGATFEYPDGTALVIKALKTEGLIPTWNLEHVSESQELQLQVDDVIVDVNSVTGSSRKMAEAVQQATSDVVLIVRRPKVSAPMAQSNPVTDDLEKPQTEEPQPEPQELPGEMATNPEVEAHASGPALTPPLDEIDEGAPGSGQANQQQQAQQPPLLIENSMVVVSLSPEEAKDDETACCKVCCY
jgi:hypothetical protein